MGKFYFSIISKIGVVGEAVPCCTKEGAQTAAAVVEGNLGFPSESVLRRSFDIYNCTILPDITFPINPVLVI
ncbi:MAG: hypothetical protein AB2421_02910 [Thermotaleaceae bacterium]